MVSSRPQRRPQSIGRERVPVIAGPPGPSRQKRAAAPPAAKGEAVGYVCSPSAVDEEIELRRAAAPLLPAPRGQRMEPARNLDWPPCTGVSGRRLERSLPLRKSRRLTPRWADESHCPIPAESTRPPAQTAVRSGRHLHRHFLLATPDREHTTREVKCR
jgi:hypothetical protein